MQQRGLSTIEILVTLLIVALGMFGLLGLQARALTGQKASFDRKAAAELVAQFGERMRANHLGVLAGHYTAMFDSTDATPAAVTGCATPCSSAQVAMRDIDEWRIELRRRVPAAAAYIRWDSVDPTSADVSVAWPEPLASGADAVCEALATVSAAVPAGYRCYQARVFP